MKQGYQANPECQEPEMLTTCRSFLFEIDRVVYTRRTGLNGGRGLTFAVS